MSSSVVSKYEHITVTPDEQKCIRDFINRELHCQSVSKCSDFNYDNDKMWRVFGIPKSFVVVANVK